MVEEGFNGLITSSAFLAAGVAALVMLAAELLHRRRIIRASGLIFGPGLGPAVWTVAVTPARALAVGVVVWGGITLIDFDGTARVPAETAGPPRHLVICLDVSPSMYIEDAGPAKDKTRSARGAEAVASILERLDMNRTRVSVVAFYTEAKPVVIDTEDLAVARNIIDGLPIDHVFEHGETDMYSGIREAFAIAKRWPAGSASLIVLSDGDTLPRSNTPAAPLSIADAVVIGVGDRYRGSSIAGRSSKQDARALERLALRLGGTYWDANERHLPTRSVTGIAMTAPAVDDDPGRRAAALVCIGVGSGVLALMTPLLAAFGGPDPRREQERALRRRRSMQGLGSGLASERSYA